MAVTALLIVTWPIMINLQSSDGKIFCFLSPATATYKDLVVVEITIKKITLP